MGGVCTFFSVALAALCMTFPANVAPRLWITLAVLSILLAFAGLPQYPQ
jgi:hypothetical protein